MTEDKSNGDDKFNNWTSSLVGCDGGNPKSKIWIAGIEWGMPDVGAEDYYSSLPEEISNGECNIPGEYDLSKRIGEGTTNYRFDQQFAKLYSAILSTDGIQNYKEVAKNCTGEEFYKLNLFPIGFSNTDLSLWQKFELDKLLGIPDKLSYMDICREHRFPFFANEVLNFEPRLIIATGGSHLDDFVNFFSGGSHTHADIKSGVIQPKSENDNYERIYHYVQLNGGKTTLFVIPFLLNRYGLNSGHLLNEMAQRIVEVVPEIRQ